MRGKQIYIMAIKLTFPFLEILPFSTHPGFLPTCLFTPPPYYLIYKSKYLKGMFSSLEPATSEHHQSPPTTTISTDAAIAANANDDAAAVPHHTKHPLCPTTCMGFQTHVMP